MAVFENSLLVDQEGLILKELDTRRIDDHAEREMVLVRHLASAYIYARFEHAYHLIFVSQLNMLQALNAVGSSSRETIKPYYDVACLVEPDFYSNYSFDQWLNFLITAVLVRTDGDTVSITVAGREFLRFLIQEGRSFERRG